MKLATCHSIYWNNARIETMKIEADVSRGLFSFNIVGLADKSTNESKLRILSALKNSNFIPPQRSNHKVTISLLPSNTKKVSLYSDLAVAISYLAASKQISIPRLNETVCIGELGLDGNISAREDIVRIIHAAARKGFKRFIIPTQATLYLNLIPGIEICEIASLAQISTGETAFCEVKQTQEKEEIRCLEPEEYDIDKLQGIEQHKRALAVSLAGNHHMIISGPPGSGKSALMQCAGELIDAMTREEALASNTILEYMGSTDFFTRPIRQPHHSISTSGMIGGTHPSQFGEIPLSHNGILMLDELCEFNRDTLESTREFMETGRMYIHKNHSSVTLHSRTTIIATTNMCPCGSVRKDQNFKKEAGQCVCTPYDKTRYRKRLSQAMIDRFQIRCVFDYTDHDGSEPHENQMSGSAMRKAIASARKQQRFRNPDRLYNNELDIQTIERLGITQNALDCIDTLKKTFTASKRLIRNTLKVARTIADMDEQKEIDTEHILEAVRYTKNHPFE